jgi:hypothetical protein
MSLLQSGPGQDLLLRKHTATPGRPNRYFFCKEAVAMGGMAVTVLDMVNLLLDQEAT